MNLLQDTVRARVARRYRKDFSGCRWKMATATPSWDSADPADLAMNIRLPPISTPKPSRQENDGEGVNVRSIGTRTVPAVDESNGLMVFPERCDRRIPYTCSNRDSPRFRRIAGYGPGSRLRNDVKTAALEATHVAAQVTGPQFLHGLQTPEVPRTLAPAGFQPAPSSPGPPQQARQRPGQHGLRIERLA